jgi:hypothetical protein
MGYIIYDKKSTRIKSKAYKTHAAAQAQLTRMRKERADVFDGVLTPEHDPLFLYGIAELEYYAKHIERTVTKTNLMTGAEYTESVNTPLHMSPSSETYWSM